MADVTAGDSPATETEGKPAGKKKRIIMAVLGLALLGAIGFGVTMFLGGEERVAPPPTPIYMNLPEMTINLSTVGDRPYYLRAVISLEMTDEATKLALEPVMPRVLDAFQVYMRELRPSDLNGSAGIQRLKEELVRRVNLAIYPSEITGVAFTELVVQ
ncbi:flagellar basal body-associated FliL family protein [Lutibaculum baratangense]|uniref:Flagellar protein FliL n=1 Tax=Lutibaculum baratangense AMV1 TaxID=631454 RepID=V4TLW2_9HYPH|nr:flagellar basal body-associated FliL family protein [Lutibaculum baratangense]ESR26778.1 Flagellar biosynthesis protein FliL [Lutibaculum baratangense AMV1]